MRAKKVDFEVTYINLRDKPEWFLELSPHGKVPMLQVDGRPLFESNAIAEYLDEEIPPRLHPEDAFLRARHRAWNDFVPIFASGLGGVSVADLEKRKKALEVARRHVGKLEQAISEERGNGGPFFSGPDLCLVDAAYAPFLMRFSMVEPLIETGLMADFSAGCRVDGCTGGRSPRARVGAGPVSRSLHGDDLEAARRRGLRNIDGCRKTD